MDAETKHNRLIKKLETQRVIDESTECWLWTGGTYPNGYGRVSYDHVSYSVHRISAWLWLDFNIFIYDTRQVNHKPDCPNKNCFNPDHLYIGTQSQNLIDYYKSIYTGFCPYGHPNESMYTYISKDGKKYRWCKICRDIANAMRRFKE